MNRSIFVGEFFCRTDAKNHEPQEIEVASRSEE